MRGPALIAAVKQKMKEIYNKPIRQALEEANRDVRNALSKVGADSKDHE